jgi:hypothetical protein
MLDPAVALRAAVGQTLDDIGLAPPDDERLIEIFLRALKRHGYIVIREFNGAHPDVRKE